MAVKLSKAEKKLAKQRAREQLLLQIRKDTLAREAALDEKTLKKIKDKWLDALIETKVPQMQDNLKQILYYMEKLVEAENFRKLLFEEERQEQEEKTALLGRSHSSALEMLCDIYERRIQDLRKYYTDLITDKRTQAEEEFKTINEHELATQENMQTMLQLMNDNKEKKEEIMNYGMFLKIDDEKSKNIEILDSLQTKMEKKMEKRWGEITNVLNAYEKNTSTRRKEYIALKAKDDNDSRTIFQQMKKTQKLFEQVEELKNCIDECYVPKEMITFIQDLREERTQFFETFKQLKVIVAEELKGDEINLKNLTMSSEALTNDLKNICLKGEQILTLYRICLRLETQYEKVFPVGYSFKFRRVVIDSRKKKKTEGKEKEKENENEIEDEKEETDSNQNFPFRIQDFEVLDNFWRKVGNVKLSKMALKKCTENLEKENKLLQQILASYFRDFSQTKGSGKEETRG